MLLGFFHSTFIILIFSIILILSGIGLIKFSTSTKENPPLLLYLGLGYFIGMAFLLTSWSLLESVIGEANISLYLSIFLMLFIIFSSSSYKELYRIKLLFYNHKKEIIIIFLVFPFLIISYNLPPNNLSLWESFGTPLGIRYANISIFINQTNTIPSVSQNSGQSILAAIPLFFGLQSTALFNLYLWLISTMSALAAMIFGFFRYLQISALKSYLGLFFVMFANASLSLIHTHVIDSHSPLFANGYSHDIFSAGSFFSMLLLIRWIFLSKIRSLSTVLIIFSSLIVSWCLTAPQNIIIGFPLVFFLGILCLKNKKLSKKILVCWTMGSIFCLGIGLTQGGFLSPLMLHDKVQIPGLTKSPINKLYLLNPGINYSNVFINQGLQYPDPYRFHKNINLYKKFLMKNNNENYSLKLDGESYQAFLKLLVITEVEFWLGIRIMFFPILGIIFLIFCLSSFALEFKWYSVSKNELSVLKYFSFTISFSFLVGFMIVFLLYINGMKWPLSRFFLPGYNLAIISLFIALKLFIDKSLSIKNNSKKIWIIIVTLITFGPFSNILLTSTRNIFSVSPDGMNFFERSKQLIDLPDMVYK